MGTYSGAATPLMLALGADVLIGTGHEAFDAGRKGLAVSAFFDVRSGNLVSTLGSRPDTKDDAIIPKAPTRKALSNKDLLQEILRRLDGMDEDLRRLSRDNARILDEVRLRKKRGLW